MTMLETLWLKMPLAGYVALACSLMHQLQGRLGVKLSTKNAMWSWALRHAAWLISRFSVIRGATAHELAFGGKRYDGELCEYGEPVFAYIQPTTKASARWKRMVFLGKAEVQNSYVLFDGESVVMSRSVRRIGTTWRSHLGYYVHCKCFSWQFKSGFGARILPTMKKVVPKAVSFEVPLGRLEDTRFHDAEAEAVILHAEKEQRREEEQWNMSRNDQRWEQPAANVPADPGGVDSAPGTENPGGASSGSGVQSMILDWLFHRPLRCSMWIWSWIVVEQLLDKQSPQLMKLKQNVPKSRT